MVKGKAKGARGPQSGCGKKKRGLCPRGAKQRRAPQRARSEGPSGLEKRGKIGGGQKKKKKKSTLVLRGKRGRRTRGKKRGWGKKMGVWKGKKTEKYRG